MGLNLGLKRCSPLRIWLGWQIYTIAVDVKLPAVIGAAEAAFLVAVEIQACAPMRTGLDERANLALGVAKHDEILAEEAHTLGRAVGFGKLG